MALIKCEECGNDVSTTAKTCPHCGISLEPKNEDRCPECGKKVKSGESKCLECGFPLTKSSNSDFIQKSLDKITGAESKTYITFKDLFKDSFKKHDEKELDEIFVCGGEKTTPSLKEINPKSASAWVYLKILFFFVIVFIPLYAGYMVYGNTNFLPGLIMISAFAVPVSVLIFFFEIDLFKSIPFYKVMKYFLMGGALSLILAILYFSMVTLNSTMTFQDAITVGIIEEVAKAAIVAIFLFREKRANYILDGLLIGAAVGAGFAAFETAGYILRFGLDYGAKTMMEVMRDRAILAPGGHVAWAAIEGAGLMFVKGFSKLDKRHLNNPKFLIICLIPIVLHSVWDMPINLPYHLLYYTLIVLAWIVVIYFVNLGLKQIDDAKKLKKE